MGKININIYEQIYNYFSMYGLVLYYPFKEDLQKITHHLIELERNTQKLQKDIAWIEEKMNNRSTQSTNFQR